MMSYCVKRITDRLSKHECIKTFVLPHSLSSKSPVTKNHFGKLITPSLNIFQNALYAFTKKDVFLCVFATCNYDFIQSLILRHYL